MTPDSGTRGESHVAKWLRRSCVDGRPHVDAQVVREHSQLVDEGDVDMPKGVLQQLGELGLFTGRHRHSRLDDRVVEGLDSFERRRVDAGHNFGCVTKVPGRVSWIDPLRAVAVSYTHLRAHETV